MIFVDSSVWIDYFNGADGPHIQKLQKALGSERLFVGDLVIVEVLQGFSKKREFEAALDLLLEMDVVVGAGRRVSVTAARNFLYLRSLGFTIRKTIDNLIATRCILSGFSLLHNDRDFVPFQRHLGLECVVCD